MELVAMAEGAGRQRVGAKSICTCHRLRHRHALRANQNRRKDVSNKAIIGALSSLGLLAVAMPSYAAEVTYERLLNSAQAEPQNWLMVHRDYNNSRHSPLKDITKANAK